MIVRAIDAGENNGRAVLRGEVEWEDSARHESVYFEVDGVRRGVLGSGGEAFLAACAVPAMLSGERRVRVEGPVYPMLLDGVRLNLRMLRQWYGNEYVLPALECAEMAGNRRRPGAAGRGGPPSFFPAV